MTNTLPAGAPQEDREGLNEILGDALKLFFQGWKLVLGAGIPLSMVAALAAHQVWRAGFGAPTFLLAISAINLGAIAVFAPLWLSWAEERLRVSRWPRPFVVSFAWALLGMTLIIVIGSVIRIGAEVLITDVLRWEISSLGSVVLTKVQDMLSFSLTGPLVAGWILVGRKLPVFGALAKSFRRQFHFLLACFLLSIIGSLCGAAVGAALGALFGFFGAYGTWAALLIEIAATILACTLYLTFSLIAFHRLYPELLVEPNVR